MAGIPPVLVTPPPLPKSPESNRASTWWAWLVPTGLLSLFVFGSLAAYFSPKHPSLEDEVSALRTALKLSVTQGSMADSIQKRLEGKDIVAPEKPDFGHEIAQVMKLAEPQDMSEEAKDARRLVWLTQKYCGTSISDKVISSLEESSDTEDKALAKVLTGTMEDRAPAPPPGADFDHRLAWAVTGYKKPYAEADLTSVVGKDKAPKMLVLAGAAVAVLGLGVIALIALVVGLAVKAIRPVGYRTGMSKAAGDALALRFGMYLFGFALIGIGIGSLSGLSGVGAPVASVAAMMATLAMLPLILKLKVFGFVHSIKSVLGDVQNPLLKLATGVGTWLAISPVTVVLTLGMSQLLKDLPTPSHELVEELQSAAGPSTWLLLGFVAVILAPLIEETMFRGVFFPALNSRFGKPVIAAIVCGLGFAMIHPQGPIMWPALALIGSTAAMLTYYTGSLLPAFALHACQNFAALAANWLVNS